MQLRSLLLHIVVMIMIALSGSPQSFAATQTADIPPWLQVHVGTGEDPIAPVVLQRGRALFQQRVSEGAIKNPCYFAMDATRPSTSPGGGLGRRFYIAPPLLRKSNSGMPSFLALSARLSVTPEPGKTTMPIGSASSS